MVELWQPIPLVHLGSMALEHGEDFCGDNRVGMKCWLNSQCLGLEDYSIEIDVGLRMNVRSILCEIELPLDQTKKN